MFENVDGRMTDAGVIGILIAHLGAFGSGELKIKKNLSKVLNTFENIMGNEAIALKGANALFSIIFSYT